MKFAIPESMRVEHANIHGALIAATRRPGPVGAAAQELARVLHPHFVREEEVALPPLGLLEPLARGAWTPDMVDVLPMTDALRAELPEMLRQHQTIGAAARHLEAVATEQGDVDTVELARELQKHARTEEQIMYPAAILVGDLVRARR